MYAEVNPKEFGKVLSLVAKGVYGKARATAVGLLSFTDDGIEIEFNDLAGKCSARVAAPGLYALNPFIAKDIIETFKTDKTITFEIDNWGLRIGTLRLSHSRIGGFRQYPRLAVALWKEYQRQLSAKKLRKRQKENALQKLRTLDNESLWVGRKLDFRRADGEIEYGAVILQYERSEASNRRVFVKTKDFQEVWITEWDIVGFDLEPSLDSSW